MKKENPSILYLMVGLLYISKPKIKSFNTFVNEPLFNVFHDILLIVVVIAKVLVHIFIISSFGGSDIYCIDIRFAGLVTLFFWLFSASHIGRVRRIDNFPRISIYKIYMYIVSFSAVKNGIHATIHIKSYDRHRVC